MNPNVEFGPTVGGTAAVEVFAERHACVPTVELHLRTDAIEMLEERDIHVASEIAGSVPVKMPLILYWKA